MDPICRSIVELPDAAIERVTFYKRDELTTDLICLELIAASGPILAHEELKGWDEAIGRLSRLPGFDLLWFEKVSKPAFAACSTIAWPRRSDLLQSSSSSSST